MSELPLDPSWQYVVLALGFLLISGIPTWIMLLRSHSTNKKVDRVEQEVTHNHGASMKDVVSRIESTLNDHIQESNEKHAATDAAIKSVREEILRPFWRR